jgi:hypothetical protein
MKPITDVIVWCGGYAIRRYQFILGSTLYRPKIILSRVLLKKKEKTASLHYP